MHVLVDLHVVGHRRQRAELQAELVLGGGDLVVVLLDARRPSAAIAASISPRMSCAESTGGTGK